MKDYGYRVEPTIINDKICVFNIKILCRQFFREKIVYTASCIVNRDLKADSSGTIIANDKVLHCFYIAEESCKYRAKIIFQAYES